MITAYIKRKERKTPTVETIYFEWDSEILPGQFVMIWVPGVGEIPMSISHIGRVERNGYQAPVIADAPELPQMLGRNS